MYTCHCPIRIILYLPLLHDLYVYLPLLHDQYVYLPLLHDQYPVCILAISIHKVLVEACTSRIVYTRTCVISEYRYRYILSSAGGGAGDCLATENKTTLCVYLQQVSVSEAGQVKGRIPHRLCDLSSQEVLLRGSMLSTITINADIHVYT